MNRIPTKQNEPKQIQRLAAQRQLYSRAKSIFAVQMVVSAPVAIAWSLLVLRNPSLKAAAAFWGVAATGLDLFWLNPWHKRLREQAAKVQEEFDCYVLELPWNDIKVGKRPDAEAVKEFFDAYSLTE